MTKTYLIQNKGETWTTCQKTAMANLEIRGVMKEILEQLNIRKFRENTLFHLIMVT